MTTATRQLTVDNWELSIVNSGVRRRGGFTMVELLTVISIIAILASILFPVFARAREKTRQMACRGNLHQIGMALQMYARDFDGRLPAEHNNLRVLMLPYVNGVTVFRCPSDGEPMLVGSTKIDNTISLGGPDDRQIRVPAGPLQASYQYRGGLSTQNRGDLPVAADWAFVHTETANVLDLSGAVRTVHYDAWKPVAPGPRPGRTAPTAEAREGATPFLPIPWSGAETEGSPSAKVRPSVNLPVGAP